MSDDRPAWARRMLNERQARGWSQADAIKAMRAHAPIDPRTRTQVELPSTSSLIRQYKRWGAGEVEPDKGKAQPFYKPIIAAMFGTVTHAMFPVASKRDADGDVLAVTGMDTLELVSRLQRSDLDQATLTGSTRPVMKIFSASGSSVPVASDGLLSDGGCRRVFYLPFSKVRPARTRATSEARSRRAPCRIHD